MVVVEVTASAWTVKGRRRGETTDLPMISGSTLHSDAAGHDCDTAAMLSIRFLKCIGGGGGGGGRGGAGLPSAGLVAESINPSAGAVTPPLRCRPTTVVVSVEVRPPPTAVWDAADEFPPSASSVPVAAGAASPTGPSSDRDNNRIIEKELLETTAVHRFAGAGASLVDDEDAAAVDGCAATQPPSSATEPEMFRHLSVADSVASTVGTTAVRSAGPSSLSTARRKRRRHDRCFLISLRYATYDSEDLSATKCRSRVGL